MKAINYFFFYTYIGVFILAGFWGAFISPVYDFKLLFHQDINAFSDSFRINLLNQYRFLRAVEMGFGLFALLFTQEIFTIEKFNTLFLLVMGAGIISRLISFVADGYPNAIMFFFLGFELIGFIFISTYSRSQISA